MTRMHRREFLSKSRNLGVGAAVGWTILKNAGSARGTPANEKIVLGLIGAGGRGSNLAADFAARGDCHFACISDCDSGRFASLAQTLAAEPGFRAAGSPGLSPGARRQVGRRGDCRHSRSLARLGHDSRVPGGQGRVCGKAAQPQLLGRPQDDRGGAQVQPHRAGRHAEPQRAVLHGGAQVHRRRQARQSALLPHLQSEGLGQFPAAVRTATRRRDSIGIAGMDRHPRRSTTRRTIRTGITSGATRAATSSTTASTRSTWLAWCWGSIIPRRSTPPAPASNQGRPSRRTRRWPCTTSTTWWSRSN